LRIFRQNKKPQGSKTRFWKAKKWSFWLFDF